MKKIRLNTKFLATEGIPELLTIGMIPFTMLAYFCGWCHGSVETISCAVVFVLCTWVAGCRKLHEVKNNISRLHFGVFGLSFLFMMAVGVKLYAMTDTASSSRLFILAVAMAPCLLIGVGYNNTIRKAEEYEEKAVLYDISPVDVIPDIPVVGWVYDFFITVTAGLNLIQQYTSESMQWL